MDDRNYLRYRDGLVIAVKYEYPPIPWRNFDYIAFVDGEDGIYGHGSTEEEAIDHLVEQVREET